MLWRLHTSILSISSQLQGQWQNIDSLTLAMMSIFTHENGKFYKLGSIYSFVAWLDSPLTVSGFPVPGTDLKQRWCFIDIYLKDVNLWKHEWVNIRRPRMSLNSVAWEERFKEGQKLSELPAMDRPWHCPWGVVSEPLCPGPVSQDTQFRKQGVTFPKVPVHDP